MHGDSGHAGGAGEHGAEDEACRTSCPSRSDPQGTEEDQVSDSGALA